MGCGKSSVGRRLSELLCCRFVDLDAEIEERCGCTVADIFAECGEAEFRRIEKETLKDILETGGRVLEISPSSSTPACKNQEHPSNERPQMMLALGGGAVMTSECERMVHEQTVCVYLRTSVDELVARLSEESAGRPLLHTTPPTNNNTSLQAKPDTSLRAEPDTSLRAERGNLQTSALRTRILNLMRQRAETYERIAHLVIDTDYKTIDQVASEIISLLP